MINVFAITVARRDIGLPIEGPLSILSCGRVWTLCVKAVNELYSRVGRDGMCAYIPNETMDFLSDDTIGIYAQDHEPSGH